MERTRGGALPLLLAAVVAMALVAGASFLQCDDHLGSCEGEREHAPGEEPVLARLLPAEDARAAATRQDSGGGPAGRAGQAVASETVDNAKREHMPQPGVSKDATKVRPNTPVAVPKKYKQASTAEGLPKISAVNPPKIETPATSVAQKSITKQSDVKDARSKETPNNKVKVVVDQKNVVSKTEQRQSVEPSGATSRKKREVVSNIPDQALDAPSRKSNIAAGQSKGVQTGSSRKDTVRTQESVSSGARKAEVNPVNSLPAGGKDGTSKPSAANVKAAQVLPPATGVIKEAQKQSKHLTEKQNRHVESIQHTQKNKASPASGDGKVNANVAKKDQGVKSQNIVKNGEPSLSEEKIPKTPKEAHSQGNGQKEVIKRFRPSEESHGTGKAQKTHNVKSQDSPHQEHLQGKIRHTSGSAEGKKVSETKSKSVVAPNKILSDTYKEKGKDPTLKMRNIDIGGRETSNNKVIAPTIRNTPHIPTKIKNNVTSQDVNIQNEKHRVRREIGEHTTMSVTNVPESSQLNTDHFGEMRLNESVKNSTVRKVTLSNRSATEDDSYKAASTTIVVDGNLFKDSGSKTWKLSTTNTSQTEARREAAVEKEKKSTKLPGSSLAESKDVSSEKPIASDIATGNRVNNSESDKSRKRQDTSEVPIFAPSHDLEFKPENTGSGLHVKEAQAEQTNITQDKSKVVKENTAEVPSQLETPISSPSRGETTLRVKIEAAPKLKVDIRNESIRVETPPVLSDKVESQTQEMVPGSDESQEVAKLKKDDEESAGELSKGVKNEKTEVAGEEFSKTKTEESASNNTHPMIDTGLNSNEPAVNVVAALANEIVPKGEPVSQRYVSFQEKDDCDKESRSLTEPAASESSVSTKGEVVSPVVGEGGEESKEALPPAIKDTASERGSLSGTDEKPQDDNETGAGAEASTGEPERGGPVSDAIQSQPPEEGSHALEAELRTHSAESLADAVAQKWEMPEPAGRVEEPPQSQPQPKDEDQEEAERLLLLADRLRQRDGGRRDVEDERERERERDRERDRLDEPQLHFPSVPPGEDFHAAELGLSDGIFLFGYLSSFISWLQPQDFPVELVRDALWNRISLTDLITETLQVEVGFIAVLSAGVALALVVPLTALGITCCRLLEARADSCRDTEPSACRRRSLLCGLWTVLLLMAVGVAAMFASNEQVSAAVQWSPRVLHTALSDTAAFVRSAHHQIGFVASKSLDQALAAAVEDLDSADALLGAPIQRELSRETGVDVALDALSDVSAAAEAASQRAAGVLEQAAQARGLALVARERLADLRYQLDAARRQCAARDRPLCDTVDAGGLDVSVRLETLLSDERLLALRDLRNGNLSAAAQQARADFQLLPRQVLESTRDARLGIRRELVRERAQLQESLSPLDAFSRSVSGRVDGARAAAQDAARVVADADYWRWLAGLGAALTVLVIWLLLAAGGGCGCCGSQEKARPLLITAVATASVLSVLVWAVTLVAFSLGAHGEVLACRPLYSAPDYPQLSRLLDRPGVLFPAAGFFRNVAGSNASLDVPLKDVLQECELGQPAYQALRLRQLFDSDAATGRGGQWEGVRQQVARLRVDLAELRVLTPGLQAQLEDTLRAASANLTLHRIALQGPVTARDLQALADQLLSVSSQVADLSSASRLETLAARAKRLLSSHISPLEQRKEDLVYRLTALEVALSPLQRQTNQSLSHLKTIQYFVSKQGESIAAAAVRRYADRLLGYLQQARAHVLAQVGRHVAPCRPLFDVFHAARQLLCRHALDPLNGLWFSSACCLVLLVAAVPLSLHLADAYRRRDSSASLLGSRNSEWQVEKSSKDLY